jgi:hypothetical protein
MQNNLHDWLSTTSLHTLHTCVQRIRPTGRRHERSPTLNSFAEGDAAITSRSEHRRPIQVSPTCCTGALRLNVRGDPPCELAPFACAQAPRRGETERLQCSRGRRGEAREQSARARMHRSCGVESMRFHAPAEGRLDRALAAVQTSASTFVPRPTEASLDTGWQQPQQSACEGGSAHASPP